MRGHDVEAHAHGKVTAAGGGKDGRLDGLAALQRRLQEVEKKPGAVAPLHRQREQIVQQHGKRTARQQDENPIAEKSEESLG